MSDLSSEERFELISGVAVEGMKELLTDTGFERHRIILLLEASNSDDSGTNHAGTLSTGAFSDKAAVFAMLMEHASAMAELLGFKFIVTQATAPANPTRGQG
jgi:hypothetical protein